MSLITSTHVHTSTLQMAGMNPDASKWEPKDVSKWLESRGLSAHVKVFKDNDVNGNLLLRLDKVFYVCVWICAGASSY